MARIASGRRGVGGWAAVAAAVLGVACGGSGDGSGRLSVGQGSASGGSGSGSGSGTGSAYLQGLTATAVSHDTIDLAWVDLTQSEDGFRILRSGGLIPGFIEVGRVARDHVTYSDSGLSAGTTYTYRVVAFARGTDLGASNDASATTATSCDWTEQLGTVSDESFRSAAYESGSGGVFLAGFSDAGFGGLASRGGFDGYVQAFDASSGQASWVAQLGTTGDDRLLAIAVDGSALICAGYSDGGLGGTNQGGFDAFVAKLDLSGRVIWTTSYGTGRDDLGVAIASDGRGGILLGGQSREIAQGNAQDPFIVKLDSAGNPQWTWTAGTSFYNENLTDIAVDVATGDVYAIGRSQAFMPGAPQPTPNSNNNIAVGDIFVAKVDSQGRQVWIQQIGSPSGGSTVPGSGHDLPGGVAVGPQGEVYVTGFAQGDANGPGSYLGPATSPIRQDWNLWGDAVLFKLDAQGTLVWTKQFGSAESDWAYDVAVTQSGKVYVTGFTKGDMTGLGQAKGGVDLFIAAFSSTGTQEWIQQHGTSADDQGFGITTDGSRQLFVAGMSMGDLAGPGALNGATDAVLMHTCD